MTKKQPKKELKSEALAEDVVDAEFEPVEELAREQSSHPRQPAAWPLVWALFAIALFGGGLLGVIGGKVFSGPTSSGQFETTVRSLSAQLEAAQEQLKASQSQLALNEISTKAQQLELTALSQSLAELASAPSAEPGISAEQVDAILIRVQQLETRPLPIVSSAGDLDVGAILAPVEQRLADVEALLDNLPDWQARFAEITNNPVTPQPDIDVQAIFARLDQLENQTSSKTTHAARKLALADLKLAVQGANPFAVEFAAMQLVSSGDPGLAKISSIAASGAPTRADLANQLQSLIPDILRQVAKPADDASLVTKTGAAFKGLISVRRTDGKGSALEQQLHGIELAMNNDDLAAAISQMQSLEGVALTASESWLSQAKARQKIEQVLAELLREQFVGEEP